MRNTFLESLKDRHREQMSRLMPSRPRFDPEEFPNREGEGLEGPFHFQNGKVLYYDRKEGKYYDSKTDMFLDDEELKTLH